MEYLERPRDPPRNLKATGSADGMIVCTWPFYSGLRRGELFFGMQWTDL
jgi:hypothetical protein